MTPVGDLRRRYTVPSLYPFVVVAAAGSAIGKAALCVPDHTKPDRLTDLKHMAYDYLNTLKTYS
jgi:hypothetical protein